VAEDDREIGVAGIITGVVVGVVVAVAGAVTNYFLAKWRDERHWQREDEVRKQESKQRAYEDFTALTFLPDRFHETSEQSEHYEQLAAALARMDLYGAPDVREAAKRAYNLEVQRDEHEEESEEYERLGAQLDTARVAFRDAARKELEVHADSPGPIA
jgi:methylthioribose-1-phosphate isomerase